MAKGLGLRIMHYRAQKIGGQLDIQPGVLADGQNRGTIVTCMFQASNANATNA
jgi:nitrate/nitrite-specific signal transduction histidine kinase